jgi:hypothetical protein
MSRFQIMLGSLAVIVVWVLIKWWIRSHRAARSAAAETAGTAGAGPAAPRGAQPAVDLDSWYQAAQEQMFRMDDTERRRRQLEWDALPKAERLSRSERFLRERFGPQAAHGLSPSEKMALGRVSEVVESRAAGHPPLPPTPAPRVTRP